MRLKIVPTSLRDASAFIALHHRHHKPPHGMKFAVAVADEIGGVRGVAVVGRPVARMADDGRTLEVVRCCTDGTPNACSALYGAAWRVSREMGYSRIITYTLNSEDGGSLRAAGWLLDGPAGGGSWHRDKRPRTDSAPITAKQRWSVSCGPRGER